jgi:hypothetical protein
MASVIMVLRQAMVMIRSIGVMMAMIVAVVVVTNGPVILAAMVMRGRSRLNDLCIGWRDSKDARDRPHQGNPPCHSRAEPRQHQSSF